MMFSLSYSLIGGYSSYNSVGGKFVSNFDSYDYNNNEMSLCHSWFPNWGSSSQFCYG